MAAPPPPPPPPPPPGPGNAPKADNKKLLASICQGTTLKKVPDSEKNDRSGVIVGAKTGGPAGGGGKSGPMVPPGGQMSIAEALAIRTQTKSSPAIPPVPHGSPGLSAIKKPNVPPPNVVQTHNVPPPPSSSTKPISMSEIRPPLPPPNSSSKPVSMSEVRLPLPPPNNCPPPPQNKVVPDIRPIINFPPPVPNMNSQILPPPPPPSKDIKPRFRPPPRPICNKPTVSADKPQVRGPVPVILPPPPMPSFSGNQPPRFAPPPPPPPPPPAPPSVPSQISVGAPIVSIQRPNIPVRIESNMDFDSRFTFLSESSFPNPSSVARVKRY